MGDVFILGAGFSKAINGLMPTLDDLSEEVITDLLRISSYEGSAFNIQDTLIALGNNIELWMTYLSQQQPWLKEEHHHRNLALAREIRQQIRDVIVRRKESALQTPPPEWLNTLAMNWHSRRTTVVTMNYDTIVESAAKRLTLGNDSRICPGDIYPAYFADADTRSGVGQWGGEIPETFSYLKLHGSTNWYYSGRDEFYGETIFYSDVPCWGRASSRTERNHHPQAGDKEWLVIPPVTDKLTYFNNESIRRMWWDASQALWSATNIFIIGYSLPLSDLGMRFFLHHSFPNADTLTPIYIIDRNRDVVERYQEIFSNLNIKSDFCGGDDVVPEFVDFYNQTV